MAKGTLLPLPCFSWSAAGCCLLARLSIRELPDGAVAMDDSRDGGQGEMDGAPGRDGGRGGHGWATESGLGGSTGSGSWRY
jgi:hypothetical protein